MCYTGIFYYYLLHATITQSVGLCRFVKQVGHDVKQDKKEDYYSLEDASVFC